MRDQQIDIWINRAEGVWLKSIENHITALFSGTFLPSHDHTHHRRVWHISRQLIREIGKRNDHMDYQTVEGILIASWFHDVGLIHSTDENHGVAGSDMCRAYFRHNEGILPRSFEELLEAIRRHDQKEEQIYSGIERDRRPEILAILSMADDLEALGTIGIYRYAEIYLERGIPLGELGERVVRNVNSRFHRLSGCSLCEALIRSYSREWKELVSFYEQYTKQLAATTPPEMAESGPLGVVNLIRTAGLEEHVRPELLWTRTGEERYGRFVNDYFLKLHHELEKARC